jgi:hypothetical protein
MAPEQDSLVVIHLTPREVEVIMAALPPPESENSEQHRLREHFHALLTVRSRNAQPRTF